MNIKSNLKVVIMDLSDNLSYYLNKTGRFFKKGEG
jgi:hypothetical protein